VGEETCRNGKQKEPPEKREQLSRGPPDRDQKAGTKPTIERKNSVRKDNDPTEKIKEKKGAAVSKSGRKKKER